MITTRQANRSTIKPEPPTEEERNKKILTTRDVKLKPKEEIDPEKVKNIKSLKMTEALKPGWGRKE